MSEIVIVAKWNPRSWLLLLFRLSVTNGCFHVYVCLMLSHVCINIGESDIMQMLLIVSSLTYIYLKLKSFSLILTYRQYGSSPSNFKDGE